MMAQGQIVCCGLNSIKYRQLLQKVMSDSNRKDTGNLFDSCDLVTGDIKG